MKRCACASNFPTHLLKNGGLFYNDFAADLGTFPGWVTFRKMFVVNFYRSYELLSIQIKCKSTT